MNLYIDVHVLQSLPPNCLNRDDTGSPKTAMYGGARRARVSSQAWKRAMRVMFADNFDKSELSMRTKYIFDMIADEVQKLDPNLDRSQAIKYAEDVMAKVEVKPTKDKKSSDTKLDALFFLSHQQAKNLAALALGKIGDKDDKKAITEAIKSNSGIDLALFGRMVAANQELNTDACAQVAHAISTHRVENEYDYFTAVDDLVDDPDSQVAKTDAGASHIGTAEFSSATLYRYATVAVGNLRKELGQAMITQQAVREFARAFVCSIPTGRQNTFAAHTTPDAVLVCLRTDRPLNLAGAFESPVRGEGIMMRSCEALEKYALEAYEDFCTKPQHSYVVGRHLGKLGERLTLDEMLHNLENAVGERLAP